MLDHEGRQLAIEFVQQQQVAITHLVEHSNCVPLAIVRFSHGVNGAHVRDIATITDGHIIQVVADILNQAVITDGHIT